MSDFRNANVFCLVWWVENVISFYDVVRFKDGQANIVSEQHTTSAPLVPLAACFEWVDASVLFRDGQLSGCCDVLALPYVDLCSRRKSFMCRWIAKLGSGDTETKLDRKGRKRWFVPAGMRTGRRSKASGLSPPDGGNQPPEAGRLLSWLLARDGGCRGGFRVGLRTLFISMSLICWKLHCSLPIICRRAPCPVTAEVAWKEPELFYLQVVILCPWSIRVTFGFVSLYCQMLSPFVVFTQLH